MNQQKNNQEFLELLRSVDREGVEDVIEYLQELGFFEAPASAGHHLNVPGGLVQHSLNVCHLALELKNTVIKHAAHLEQSLSKDSIIIAALLHDVCKAEIYKPVTKKRKNVYGVWEDVPGYDVDYSDLPIGHGEKSVVRLLLCGFPLTDDEIMAIRWHMTAWDLPFQSAELKNSINKAKDICPLLTLIQAADGMASNLLEDTER